MRSTKVPPTIIDFDAVQLKIATAANIKDWSHGEVTKPETINYRTQKPERDGLFCEKIFGPVKDINPNDTKFKGVRSREVAVDKNGDIVTKSIVRRERMGHITLATPVAHIWFLRGTPSAMGQVLGMTVKSLEKVVYFASYIVIFANYDKIAAIMQEKEAALAATVAEIEARLQIEGEGAEGEALRKVAAQRSKEMAEAQDMFNIIKIQSDSLVEHALISEADFREFDPDLKATVKVGMGAGSIKEIIDKINLKELIEKLSAESDEAKGMKKKKLSKRLRMLESMDRAGIDPSSVCMTILPVIPPDLRPMVQLTGGRFATSDMNDLYRRVINRNNRLKKLIELNAPEVIKRNEMRMLQEAVDSLIDNNATRNGKAVAAGSQRRRLKSISDMLKGKQGRFRQNLLGKRVDYSGRSVIVAGPELKLHQCGLPKMMALELFKPFVLGYLIQNDYAHNIRSATRLIEMGESIVWDALDISIKGKYVLLNRAPTLHRLGIQAFQPVLIEGKAIQLHPLACKGFNADFDGDQMAVHLPLSDEAQAEARNILAATKNLLKPADGTPILYIDQDIVLGLFYMTFDKSAEMTKKPREFSSIGEAVMAKDSGAIAYHTPISIYFRGENRITTLGRILFNEAFPSDFPFQNDAMSKKRLQQIMSLVYTLYGQDKAALIADDLKDLGFEYATKSGLSMGMGDFQKIDGFDELIEAADERSDKIAEQFQEGFITEQERSRLTVENWTKTDSNVQEILAKQMVGRENSLSLAINSGARGNISQMKMSVGMIGVVSDTSGQAIELPIKSGYYKGLNPLEYFTGTRGTRKALIDIALKTADSGYLTRRLVDVAQDVFTTDQEAPDPGLSITREDTATIGVTFASRLVGRYAAEEVKGYIAKDELFTPEIAAAIDLDDQIEYVKIRSLLSVQSLKGIPVKSYGIDPSNNQLIKAFAPIGVIAAQSIGEPGTQLSLDSKHRSGAVVADDTAKGLSRVEELFESRVPKGQAYLADISGKVSLWEEGNNYIVQITADESDTIELQLEGRSPKMRSGTSVHIGDSIAEGDEGQKPLVTPMAGVVSYTSSHAVISPTKQSVLKYEIPGSKTLMVADGDTVVAGNRLTAGSINLQEMLRLSGIEAAQRYILVEILRIFVGQGQNISEKHLEAIVRQMFSRVMIDDSGDSSFVIGDTATRQSVVLENEELIAAGKEPASYSQLLLGITKASLSTDSFLSAASFQDTTRVLIAAAISGKKDYLYGLKENVILGRKIPVGTGAVGYDSGL
jgi:DNA-directed RNA polymerase subunit beta'